MATPITASRMLTALVLAAAATVTTVIPVALLPVGISHADPRPTIAEVTGQVDALNAHVDVAVEDFARSKLALAAAAHTSSLAQARVHLAQRELDRVRASMSSVAAAAYRTGGTDVLVSLVNTATPQSFLERAGVLDRIAAGQSVTLAAAAAARHRLLQVQSDADAALVAQRAIATRLAALRTRIEGALLQEKHLLAGLQVQERARLEAVRRADLARAAQAARTAVRASRSRSQAAAMATSRRQVAAHRRAIPRPTARPSARPAPRAPGSGRGGIAVAAAYAELGKPYQWGAAGPGSFDCSGLTMWAWGKAGVSLSHSSGAQYGEGQHISRGALQPGDLVFYGSPIHHVGIYIGGGRMISAPHTGDVVKIQAAFRSDYVGATRP